MSIEACQTPNKFHVNSFGNEFTLLVTDYRWCVCLPEIGRKLVPNIHREKQHCYIAAIRIYSSKATKFERFPLEGGRKSKAKKKTLMIVIRRRNSNSSRSFLRTKSKLSKVNGICATWNDYKQMVRTLIRLRCFCFSRSLAVCIIIISHTHIVFLLVVAFFFVHSAGSTSLQFNLPCISVLAMFYCSRISHPLQSEFLIFRRIGWFWIEREVKFVTICMILLFCIGKLHQQHKRVEKTDTKKKEWKKV